MVKVAPPPDLSAFLERLPAARLVELVQIDGVAGDIHRYLHWDKVRYREPPEGLSREEWWFLIKTGRRPLMRAIPLIDTNGRHFAYCMPDVVQRRLHHIDQRCSGEIAMPAVVTTDQQARQHFLVNSLMEEAIRSSQLEGATTTRQEAKELLRSGRPPADRSERMITNNYSALQFMRQAGRRLTPALIFELQRILTEGTLENPDAAGRLQTPADARVAVIDAADGRTLHAPPAAGELPSRLQALCDFANEDDSKQFIHPVVRGILLHFWLAYDHPFEDGNGRTARALFYWYMRKRKYWLVEYLSISRILRDAPAQYGRAYLLSETDDNDVTYFIDFQLEVIERAIRELYEYLTRKTREAKEVEMLIQRSRLFNHRQIALIGYALRHPDGLFTFRTHAASHGVTHETARNDLLRLVDLDLLDRRTMRGRHIFSPQPDLPSRLQGLS